MANLIRFAIVLILVSLSTSHVDSPKLLAQDPMRVATYNIRYANRGDGLDQWANRSKAVGNYLRDMDICGLQEVTYPQLVQLRDQLTQFAYYGVGRDDGEHGGEHAVIFFRKQFLKEIDKGTFWLSEEPERIGVAGWDAALPRTCTWIQLEDQRTKEQFIVGNTHFDHRGAIAREKSGELIKNQLSKIAGDLPVVLMGDFNCIPDSSPYQAILSGGQFSDSMDVSLEKPVGPRSTWNGFRGIAEGREIDHVFVRGDLQVHQRSTDDPRTQSGRFASDHLPVQVLVSLGRSLKNK